MNKAVKVEVKCSKIKLDKLQPFLKIYIIQSRKNKMIVLQLEQNIYKILEFQKLNPILLYKNKMIVLQLEYNIDKILPFQNLNPILVYKNKMIVQLQELMSYKTLQLITFSRLLTSIKTSRIKKYHQNRTKTMMKL